MKNKLIYISATAAILTGCDYLGFGSGFDFAQLDDKIEGTKLVAHRQFQNESKTLVADAKFVCNIQRKSLSLELASYNQPDKKGDEKLTGSAYILTDDGLPSGKVKFGTNDAMDLSSLFGLEMTSFSNVAKWNVEKTRVTTDWVNMVTERNKISSEIEAIESAKPALRDFTRKQKILEENKEKFNKFEKEQLALATKVTEEFEKQNYANKIKLLKDELNIDSEEKSISEFKKENTQDITRYTELQTKFHQLQTKTEESFQKVVNSDPEASKAMKELKSQAKSNPIAAAIGVMGGAIIAETAVIQISSEKKKIAELGAGSSSDGEFLKKLGNSIALQYKAKNGEVTFSIDLTDRNLQKVMAGCQ